MISSKMKALVEGSSAIRAMFEEGKVMAAKYGAENVYDFSLGNPNVAAPKEVKQAILDILNEEDPVLVHGYMNNSGYEDVRRAVAESLNRRFGVSFGEENILMTVGAAGGLNVILKVLLNPGDEVMAIAPYFGEYNNYVANVEGRLVIVPPNPPTFQPNLKELEKRVTNRTRAIIVNSPNNPTGVIYTEKTIRELAEILERKQKEFGTQIYILCDEPYRELAYDGAEVPYIPNLYRNTIVGYSYSKSLSLPGERIGYLAMPSEIDDFETISQAANVANRILGFVNAPSLIQRAVARCLDAEADVAYYNRNRETLYNGLVELGYECIKPEGAFYLFVKSPLADEKAFVNAAKRYRLLLVPGSSFACPGYVRIAYCVAHETITNAMPQFKKLMEEIQNPLMDSLKRAEEIFWLNPKSGEKADYPFDAKDVADAEARLQRFAPYIRRAFPETEQAGGIIESPVLEISHMQKKLEEFYGMSLPKKLLLKCDSQLPVSGSIKARGGIYEVLKFAEQIALEKGMLTLEDDYSVLAEPRFKELFSKYSVAVGSTGNLGLSIGIISAKLGFRVTIHMSADARQWKKDMLREKGAIVVEYPDDYQKAVAEGRKEAAGDPMCHFVDDESSADLFLGYTTAAGRLQRQLAEKEIVVDDRHPLFVYLPCGVGGGPGGVAFGLKLIFGNNVHCFFAEPTHAPCMALGMITGLHDEICCYDVGLDGKTAADGLAVGRASKLVGKIMETQLDGVFTVQDEELYRLLALLAHSENNKIEPSACAGFPGLAQTTKAAAASGIKTTAPWLTPEVVMNATHIVWATGGSMVPSAEMQTYIAKGDGLLKQK